MWMWAYSSLPSSGILCSRWTSSASPCWSTQVKWSSSWPWTSASGSFSLEERILRESQQAWEFGLIQTHLPPESKVLEKFLEFPPKEKESGHSLQSPRLRCRLSLAGKIEPHLPRTNPWHPLGPQALARSVSPSISWYQRPGSRSGSSWLPPPSTLCN